MYEYSPPRLSNSPFSKQLHLALLYWDSSTTGAWLFPMDLYAPAPIQMVFAIKNFFKNLAITNQKPRTLAVPYNEVRPNHIARENSAIEEGAQIRAAKASRRLVSSFLSILRWKICIFGE